MALMCISPVACDINDLLMSLSAICLSSLEKYPFVLLAYLKTWVVCLFVVEL